MKRKLIVAIIILMVSLSSGAQLFQGSIEKGTGNSVNIWLKPDFSNTTEYMVQIGFPIAFPASNAPVSTDLTITQDAGFISTFGSNYSVQVFPLANNTASDVRYYEVILTRSGSGASNAQTWTSGTAFKLLNIAFAYAGTVDTSKIKLADFQDGGSDGQGYFYVADGNANYYYTTNSVNNFYAIPGQSNTGGNSAEGFAQTIDSVILSSRNSSYIPPPNEESEQNIRIERVYPNPAQANLTINLNAIKAGSIDVEILNLNGVSVRQEQIQVPEGASKELIKLTIPAGIYFLKIRQGNQVLLLQKFIKM